MNFTRTSRQQSPDNINTETMKRSIVEGKVLSEQKETAADHLPVVESAIVLLRERISAIKRRFAEEYEQRKGQPPPNDEAPFFDKSEHFTGQILNLAAIVTTMADIILSAVLASSWIDIHVIFSAIIGGGIALFLTIICKGAILHATYNLSNLLATRRKLKYVGLTTFSIVMFWCAIILMARTPTDYVALKLIPWVSISLSLLGISLPLFAGSLMAASFDYNWAFRHYTDFQNTSIKFAKFEALRAWIYKIIDKKSQANMGTNNKLQAIG